jgi:hypothetical protein
MTSDLSLLDFDSGSRLACWVTGTIGNTGDGSAHEGMRSVCLIAPRYRNCTDFLEFSKDSEQVCRLERVGAIRPTVLRRVVSG